MSMCRNSHDYASRFLTPSSVVPTTLSGYYPYGCYPFPLTQGQAAAFTLLTQWHTTAPKTLCKTHETAFS